MKAHRLPVSCLGDVLCVDVWEVATKRLETQHVAV
jgi:hypothetical protein